MELSADRKADAIMAAQWGVITRAQAVECGLRPPQIRFRTRSGRWLTLAHETYAAASSQPCWQRDLMAACLGGPPGTVASHRSAAALLGLLEPPELPHVTVPSTTSSRLRGAVVHRRTLVEEDKTVVDGFPSVGPARLLADCAEQLCGKELEDLVDDVLFQKLVTAAAVETAIMGWGTAGRKGMSELLRTLEVWTPGPHPGSQAEMRMIRRLHRRGVPLPDRQVKIFDDRGRFVARIDAGWPGPKVGLEYYGQRHHGPRKEAFDAERLRRIEAVGWQVRVVRQADLDDGGRKLYEWLAARLSELCVESGV